MPSKVPMMSSSFPKAAITFCPLYISSTYPVRSPSADCCPWKYRWECHAGCGTKDILEEVGLSFRDLGDYRPPQWKERLEFTQGRAIEAIYDYKTAEGRYLYSKVRFEGKEM